MKTPLKDEIGSYKSALYLKQIIPKGSVVYSYLLYSGQLEFSLCQNDRFVCAHTNKYAICEFWECMLDEPRRIYEIISSDNFSFPDERMLYLLQESWMRCSDAYLRSAIFYYLNRCSSTGNASSGILEPTQLNPFLLTQLKNFEMKNFHVEYQKTTDQSIFKALENDSDCDYYLIPAGEFNHNLFDEGKSRGFDTTIVDHKEIETQFKKNTDKKIVMVYKFHKKLLTMYKEASIAMINRYGDLTDEQNNCEEIIVTNF